MIRRIEGGHRLRRERLHCWQYDDSASIARGRGQRADDRPSIVLFATSSTNDANGAAGHSGAKAAGMIGRAC